MQEISEQYSKSPAKAFNLKCAPPLPPIALPGEGFAPQQIGAAAGLLSVKV